MLVIDIAFLLPQPCPPSSASHLLPPMNGCVVYLVQFGPAAGFVPPHSADTGGGASGVADVDFISDRDRSAGERLFSGRDAPAIRYRIWRDEVMGRQSPPQVFPGSLATVGSPLPADGQSVKSNGLLFFHEPHLGQRILLEKPQQHLCNLLPTAVTGMGAVAS